MQVDEFRNFYLSYLWRDNDADLTTAFPLIMQMTNSRLQNDIKFQRQAKLVEITATSDTLTMPADYWEARTLAHETWGPMTYTTPNDFVVQKKASSPGEGIYVPRGNSYSSPRRQPPYYTLIGNEIHLSRPSSVENPGTYELLYYAKLPNILTEDSWVADDHLDLYLYAALLQTATWLREDERTQVYDGMYKAALDSADVAERRKEFAGSPLVQTMPRGVA